MEPKNSTSNPSRANSKWRIFAAVIVLTIFAVFGYGGMNGNAYKPTHFFKNTKIKIFESSRFTPAPVQQIHWSSNETFIEATQYAFAKPPNDALIPLCSTFLAELKNGTAKWQLLANYDPGNCEFITDLNVLVNRTKDSKIKEVRELHKKYSNELWEKCQTLKTSLSPGQPWRLCQSLPTPFAFGKYQVQRYEYSEYVYKKAVEEVGEDCFHRPLALFMDPQRGEHRGGPRKVANAFMSGMRLIKKPYMYMAWDVSNYDFKVQPGKFNIPLLYTLNDKEATGYFLGPTVIHTQFNNGYLTPAAKSKVSIASASVNALYTQQYFPRIQMNKSVAVVIPTGVDTETFKAKVPYQNRDKIFLSYRKKACEKHWLALMEAAAQKAGYKMKEMNYGGYNEQDFFNALQIVKFALFCAGPESQGLAGEEMLAMDVPIFVTDKASVPYFCPNCGYVVRGVRGESIPNKFKDFLNKVEIGSYTPRVWILENLSYYKCAVGYLRTMCGKETPWWPIKI